MLVDGVHAVVKRDCPTCVLVAPILEVLARDGVMTSVASQDDPNFPNGMAVRDDTSLELSYHLDIDTVPTLVRISNGSEVDRTVGWSLQHWAKFLDFDLSARLAALPALSNLPPYRPGCGSKTYDPGVPERLAVTFGGQYVPISLLSSTPNYNIYGGDISAFMGGQTGELRFQAVVSSGFGITLLDNISFSNQPIPEPSSLALFGLGAFVLGFFRCRNC